MKIVILAGGSGTRLWPMSRTLYPKQFLKLGGEESFLQQTVRRYLGAVAAEDIYIITGEELYHEVVKQAAPLPKENIIVEPARKNTAPAIALASLFLKERGCGDDEVCLISPADHFISPVEKFWEAMQSGEKLAREGAIVTFGVKPTKPETGYGYIKARGNRVEKFVEKPDLETAKRYLEEGDYFWNSGIFAFTLGTILEQFARHCSALVKESYQELLEEYPSLPTISIDYAVMEKTQEAAMVPLDLSWSDIGSWESVYHHLDQDENRNAILGEVVAYETTDSLILAGKRMIATIGMKDVLVVESDDVVLLANKGDSEKVKQVVEELKERKRKEVDEHLTAHRPWGSYTVLEEGERYKIKRLHIKPLQKLSLQLHYHRSEHWVVVSGTAKVTLGGEEKIVHEGESIFVPKSSVHKVENPGKVPLEMIEVQVGEYLGEDDIVRYEDIYGRLKGESELLSTRANR